MARLALAGGSQNGGDPPAGDGWLYVAAWVPKEDARPEDEQTPTAYSVHLGQAAADLFVEVFPSSSAYKNRLLVEAAQFMRPANMDELNELPPAARRRALSFFASTETQLNTTPAKVVSVTWPRSHRLFFLLKKNQYLFLEEDGVRENARLFREIHQRLFPFAGEETNKIQKVVPFRGRPREPGL